MKGILNYLLVATLMNFSQSIALADSNNSTEATEEEDSITFADNNDEYKKTNQSYILNNKGRDLRESGKFKESRSVLEEACKLDPNTNSAVIHENLGITLEALGDLNSARDQFIQALKFAPDTPRTLFNLGCCYQQMGNVAESASYLKQYLQTEPHGEFASEAQRILKSLKFANQSENDPNAADYFKVATSERTMRWSLDKGPIKIYIADGDGVYGYNPAFKQEFIDAFEQWINAVHHRLSWELVDKKKDAQIVCRWTSNRNSFRESGSAELGETFYKFSPDRRHPGEKIITTADITLCTVGIDDKTIMTPAQMRSTCLHEIGHALGIAGHSSNTNDVMFFVIKEYGLTQLSRRDKATILRLYSQVN